MNYLSLQWFYAIIISHIINYIDFLQVNWIIWEKLQFVYLKHSFQIYPLWWEWTPHRWESDQWEIHKPIWLGPRWFCIWWCNIFINTAIPQIIIWIQNCASKTDAQNNLNFYADSKYNNVDKDWIDVKSNNYFSNEEFQENSGPPKVDLLSPSVIVIIEQESNDVKKSSVSLCYQSSDKKLQVANETLEWSRLN